MGSPGSHDTGLLGTVRSCASSIPPFLRPLLSRASGLGRWLWSDDNPHAVLMHGPLGATPQPLPRYSRKLVLCLNVGHAYDRKTPACPQAIAGFRLWGGRARSESRTSASPLKPAEPTPWQPLLCCRASATGAHPTRRPAAPSFDLPPALRPVSPHRQGDRLGRTAHLRPHHCRAFHGPVPVSAVPT